MALKMVKLVHTKSGGYRARKVIPVDIREEYGRAYGGGWEARLALPASFTEQQAKAAFGEWSSETESRISHIRARKAGEATSLTHMQAHALAGKWYKWFVDQYRDNPGDSDAWWWRKSNLIDDITDLAPGAFREDPSTDPDWDWARLPEVRQKVLAIVATEAKTAQFLAQESLVLTPAASEQFLWLVLEEFRHAADLLERYADGNYSKDKHAAKFPILELQKVTTADDSVSCWKLFEAYVIARKPAASTIDRWSGVFKALDKEFPRGTASIDEASARTWLKGLISEARSALTVRDIWRMSANSVFSWAKDEGLVTSNPFAGIKITVPKRIQTRESKAFTDREAKTILTAALKIEGDTPMLRAKRWVPWLCAYTGARVGEITQLRAEDVVKIKDVTALNLTPDAGTIKTRVARTVPLHEHILAQGFSEVVARVGKGPLFYNSAHRPRKQSNDPTKPPRSLAIKTRQHLGEWVRKVVGISDKRIQPNHAWRHTFKQRASRFGISDKVSDAITGHSPASIGQSYGAPTLDDKARELEKFPRYEI